MRTRLSRIDTADVLWLCDVEPPAGEPCLVLRAEDGTTITVTATRNGTNITADLGELALPAGTWDVLVSAADRQPTLVETADPGLSLTRWAAYLTVPRQRELRAMRSEDGRLQITARAVRPYVEVSWITVESENIAMRGNLAYTDQAPGRHEGSLLARQRRTKRTLHTVAEVVDGQVWAELPIAQLCAQSHVGAAPGAQAATSTGKSSPPAHPSEGSHWDLWLQCAQATANTDRSELRLGRHADDVAAKKRQIVLPPVQPSGHHADVRVQPFYTVHNDLTAWVGPATANP